jgi:translation initiation factor 2 subunit 1
MFFFVRKMSRHNAVRFYEALMPKEGDLVWVRVVGVNETAATVALLEYANHEGMIPNTELTRLRIRAMGKVIRVGKCEAAQVLRMDRDKGYIDLSKKNVTREEARVCEEHFIKSRDVCSIVCHAAELCEIPKEDAMRMVAWPLYRLQPGTHAFDWLKAAVKDPRPVFDPLSLEPKFRAALEQTVNHRLRVQPVKLRVDLEITCFTPEGVNAIRDVLRIGHQVVGAEEEPKIPLTVSIVAPPNYTIRAQTERKEEGLKKLQAAVDAITEEMKLRGGVVKVTSRPRVVGDESVDGEKAEAAEPENDSDEDEDCE